MFKIVFVKIGISFCFKERRDFCTVDEKSLAQELEFDHQSVSLIAYTLL